MNSNYNNALQAADSILNNLLTEEKRLNDMVSEVFSAARGKFGVDSNEIEILGGVR